MHVLPEKSTYIPNRKSGFTRGPIPGFEVKHGEGDYSLSPLFFLQQLKYNIMIHAKMAYTICQNANRENWMKLLERRISNVIKEAAEQGLSNVEVSISDFIIGAEDLKEYKEMITLFENALQNNGYSHKILPNGKLVISWK